MWLAHIVVGVGTTRPTRRLRDTHDDALEVHLTVTGVDEVQLRSFINNAQELPFSGLLKVTGVELDTEEFNDQLMLTWSDQYALNEITGRCALLEDWLGTKNVAVTRVKVESTIDHPGAIYSLYFEHHVLIEMLERDRSALGKLAEKHNARMSRRVRRRLSGDVVQVFVNQRCWDDDPNVAKQQFADLVRALQAGNFTIVRAMEEAVFVDTNTALDGDWLTTTPNGNHIKRKSHHVEDDERARTNISGNVPPGDLRS